MVPVLETARIDEDATLLLAPLQGCVKGAQVEVPEAAARKQLVASDGLHCVFTIGLDEIAAHLVVDRIDNADLPIEALILQPHELYQRTFRQWLQIVWGQQQHRATQAVWQLRFHFSILKAADLHDLLVEPNGL